MITLARVLCNLIYIVSSLRAASKDVALFLQQLMSPGEIWGSPFSVHLLIIQVLYGEVVCLPKGDRR